MDRGKINRASKCEDNSQFDGKSMWKRKPSFLISPASFLCDLVVRQKLENQLYRSESFCFLSNSKHAARRQLNVSSKSQNKDKADLDEVYADPADDLYENWSQTNVLSGSSDSGLGREGFEGPLAYHDALSAADHHQYENEGEYLCHESFQSGDCRVSQQYPQQASLSTSPSSSILKSSGLHSPLYQSLDEPRPERTRLSHEGPAEHVYENIDKGNHPAVRTTQSNPGLIGSDKVYPYGNTISSIPSLSRKRVTGRQRLATGRQRKRKQKCKDFFHVLQVVPFDSVCPKCDFVKTWTIVACRDCCSIGSDCCSRKTRKARVSSSSMARKRYETAFLPSSSSSPAARRSPDVDTLLLAIEATTIDPNDTMKQSLFQQGTTSSSPELSPSLPRPQLLLFNEDDTECRKKPLSEPLPLKKYSSNSDHHHHHHRNLKKENSISSLESLDSTKSEDLQPFVFKSLRNQKVKVLSPISDKSPLEPKCKGSSPFHIETQVEIHGSPQKSLSSSAKGNNMGAGSTATLDPWDWSRTRNVVNAAELTNVPWEMPKLRRKLAMLADSGISLDLPPREFDVADFENRNNNDHQTDFNFARPQRPESSEGFGVRTDKGGLDLRLPLRQTSFPGENMYAVEPEEFGGDYLPTSARSSSVKPDRDRIRLDFSNRNPYAFDPTVELECQDWFYGAITRCEAEDILRPTKEGSFLVRNCESSNFNQYSLSLKCARGFIHIRIEPNSLGTFSLGDQMFSSVPHLVLHFMTHRLPIKGAEHVKLVYPVINQLL